MIKIKDISYGYSSNHKVLDNLNLEIKDGSIVTILGLNGSGKSTLIKILCGLIKPNSGSISYDDKELKDMSYYERSKEFAYVSQKNGLVDDFTVEEYLLLSLNNKKGILFNINESDRQKVIDQAKTLRIEHLLKKKLYETSGGERQLISICASLIQDTKIIILDEPTSALDIKNQNLVLSTLNDIAKTQKKTIIFSTHNPNHALKLNSVVIVLHQKNIYMHGNAKDIVTKEKLKEVYSDNICYSYELEYNEISFR